MLMRNVKVSVIMKMLEDDGWYLATIKGDHRQYKHPTKPGKVTVNAKPSSDICSWLLKSIEKQSGLKF